MLHEAHSPYTIATRALETLQLLTWDIRHIVQEGQFIPHEQYSESYVHFDAWLLTLATNLSDAICVFKCLGRVFPKHVEYQQHIRIVNSICSSLEILLSEDLHEAYHDQALVVFSLLK